VQQARSARGGHDRQPLAHHDRDLGALQASENTASETNIDDTLLTLNVQTNAGQQTLSRQAIERGTGVEAVVMDDLFRRYHTNLDSTLLNQASTGLAASST
jgi:hypothetical protein